LCAEKSQIVVSVLAIAGNVGIECNGRNRNRSAAYPDTFPL